MSAYISAELRHLVTERAEGRCEYCLIPEFAGFAVHEIDHIIPRKHGGLTEADNLALSCMLCNKHKGTDSPPSTRKPGRSNGCIILAVMHGMSIFV